NLLKSDKKPKEEDMENQAALRKEDNAEVLYLAFELSLKKWKLGFSDGRAAKARVVEMAAGNLEALKAEIEKAKKRFGMAAGARVKSCYEAGREGFWLHRAVDQMGIENLVVEPASIEVNRRERRAKTDRMDAGKLLRQLLRWWRGEKDAWSVVRVPTEEAEQDRQLHRDLEVLKKERGQHRTRIQSLLFTQGIDEKAGPGFLKRLEQMRIWNQQPIPDAMKARVRREYERLQLVETEIAELKTEQKKQLKAKNASASVAKVKRLQQLAGIGTTSSWVFVMELFGWRQFQNRREVAGAVGITPTPYNSGNSVREQGISKSGNHRARTMAVEIAWSWLRLQPDSKLSQWYKDRFAGGGPRMRRVGIVAMARKLVIDLWRFVEFGKVPEGAQLKAQA